MKDYPCKFGEGCKKKDSGCNYVHPSESNYQQSVQKKESQDSRHGGPSPERNKRFSNVTASNTTALPEGVNRWGKNSSNTGGARKSSANDNNSFSSWNFSGHSTTTNGHSSNATDPTSSFGNLGWGSSDNNNASSSSWSTGGAGSSWTNDDATVGWDASSTPRDNGGWGTGNSASIKVGGSWETGASGGGKDDGGWGTSNSGGQKDGGGWGTSNSGGQKDGGGWGSSGGSWETGVSGGGKDDGGWGTSKSGGQKDGGGWGSSGADIAKASDEANKGAGSSKGWDRSTTSTLGSWGGLEDESSDAQKAKGQTRMRDDIQMRDPSPPRKNSKSAQPIPQSPPKRPAELPAQMPLSPKYVAPMSAVSTKFPADLKSLALEVARPKAAPMTIKGTEDRKTLYQSIIKHTKNAIITYIEHREAHADLNRWKETQMSTIYGHATRETRKILDSERATFHRRLQEVEDAFQKEINALVNLPDLSTTNNKRKSKVLTKKDVARYTQELQEWSKDLELHKRLLTEEAEEGEIAEEEEEGEVNEEEENIEQRISDLLRSGKWTWKKLTEVIEAMQTRYDTIQTNIYFDVFTCIEDDSKAKLTSANFESVEEETHNDDMSAVSAKIATTGKNLERQSEGLARLLSEAAELEKKIEAVRAQAAQASLVCQLAGRLFGDFEQWKVDDNAQLMAITEQVKLLRLYQPIAHLSVNQNVSLVTAAAPPHPSTSALESITSTDLIDPIRQLVIDAIHKELKLCFDNLRFRCMENQQQLETDMEEEAKRIMSKAEMVKNRLTPSRESSTRPVIPQSQSNIPSVAYSFAPH